MIATRFLGMRWLSPWMVPKRSSLYYALERRCKGSPDLSTHMEAKKLANEANLLVLLADKIPCKYLGIVQLRNRPASKA